MHGEKADAAARHLRHGPLDGFADVVELHVQENVLALRDQLIDELHAGGGVQLHADFVKIDVRAQAPDQRAGFVGRGDIQRHDDR